MRGSFCSKILSKTVRGLISYLHQFLSSLPPASAGTEHVLFLEYVFIIGSFLPCAKHWALFWGPSEINDSNKDTILGPFGFKEMNVPPKWRFSQCSLAYSSTAANLIQSLAADDTCFSISSGVCGSGIEQLCDILFFRSLGWSSNHDYWDGISKFTLCTCTCLGLTSSFLLLVLHGKVESQSSWTSSLKWWPPQDLLWRAFLNHHVWHDLLVKQII